MIHFNPLNFNQFSLFSCLEYQNWRYWASQRARSPTLQMGYPLVWIVSHMGRRSYWCSTKTLRLSNPLLYQENKKLMSCSVLNIKLANNSYLGNVLVLNHIGPIALSAERREAPNESPCKGGCLRYLLGEWRPCIISLRSQSNKNIFL